VLLAVFDVPQRMMGAALAKLRATPAGDAALHLLTPIDELPRSVLNELRRRPGQLTWATASERLLSINLRNWSSPVVCR
jgi:hypothetical protein